MLTSPKLLIAAQGERNAVLYHLALVTGLREGEIFGLKWLDLDWIGTGTY